MTTNSTALRDAVFARASGVIPAGASAWALARTVAFPSLLTSQLPALQVVMADERLTPYADENVGPPRFLSEPTISVSVLRGLTDPTVLDGQADQDIDNILDALLQDTTFTSPPTNSPFYFEGIARIENSRRALKDGEGYLLELVLKITFSVHIDFEPIVSNWLEEVKVTTNMGTASLEAFPGLINYTVMGPIGGAHGVASTAFTVALETEASFTGDMVVTVNDGGSGGTFTTSSGSSVGSMAAQPVNNAMSFTFTYTAIASGAVMLSFANQQGWPNPNAVVYTAT